MIQIKKDDKIYLVKDSGVVSAMADAGIYELDEVEFTYKDLNLPCIIVDDFGSEDYVSGFDAIYENDFEIGVDIVVDENEQDEILKEVERKEGYGDDDE